MYRELLTSSFTNRLSIELLAAIFTNRLVAGVIWFKIESYHDQTLSTSDLEYYAFIYSLDYIGPLTDGWIVCTF